MTDPEIQNVLLGINILVTMIAVLSAPIIAMKVSNRAQEKNEKQRTKLTLIGTLLSLRHDFLSYEAIKAYNLIDVVFSDEPEVREAWTRLFTVLNDSNVSKAGSIGNALVDERRRELIMAMTRTVSWTKTLTSADILRSYSPGSFTETQLIAIWKAQMEKHSLNETAVGWGYTKPFPDIRDRPTNPSESRCEDSAKNPTEDTATSCSPTSGIPPLEPSK